MQRIDRVEKRRFVGREFLLWLWFESEAFEATLETRRHGTFGFFIERHLVLSAGNEVTRIKGALPAAAREAKEALALGKLPEAAGVHVSWGDREIAFTLKGDRLALAGLSLPTVLDAAPDEAPSLIPPKRPGRGRKPPGRAEERDETHEAFYERMHLTREVEALIEALYRDFLTLRLSAAWHSVVVPMIARWVRGDGPIDADGYRKRRDTALAAPPRRAAKNVRGRKAPASARA